MQFVLDNSPSWVDICGLILSFLSLIAAGIAAWKLLARDKQRESEVDALIKLAKHNEAMWKIQIEKTKPRFTLTSERTVQLRQFVVNWRNNGAQGRIIQMHLDKHFYYTTTELKNVVVPGNTEIGVNISLSKELELLDTTQPFLAVEIEDSIGGRHRLEITILNIDGQKGLLVPLQMEKVYHHGDGKREH